MGASYFAVIPPAKFGHLGAFHFSEVGTWLLEVRFYVLIGTYECF